MGGVGGRPVGKLVTSKRRTFVQRPEKKKGAAPPPPIQIRRNSIPDRGSCSCKGSPSSAVSEEPPGGQPGRGGLSAGIDLGEVGPSRAI